MVKSAYMKASALIFVVAFFIVPVGCRTRSSHADERAASLKPICQVAFAQHAVCEEANNHALELMKAGSLEAATVIQDVSTGALIAFASSSPENARDGQLAPNSPVLPLSLNKLLVAVSWWDHNQPDLVFDCVRQPDPSQPPETVKMSVKEMVVSGCDRPGREIAVALRRSIGTDVLLADLRRFGFDAHPGTSPEPDFWGEVDQTFAAHLTPALAHTTLGPKVKDKDWADALSIGESHFVVTVLHISRFLQAVGNGGVMSAPIARRTTTLMEQRTQPTQVTRRIMKETTAARLQEAMREVVQRGSAQTIVDALNGTGWQIGGKTGTGPGPAPIGPQSDGWFAGLVFDPKGKPSFTVATYVRHGGRGAGKAASLSAEMARYLISVSSSSAR